jgi:hypothetical protein
MEPIFHLSKTPGKPFRVLMAKTEAEGLERASELINQAPDVGTGAQEKAFNGRSVGVLYWGPWVFSCDEDGGTLRTIDIRKVVFSSVFPGSQQVMWELSRRMFDAGPPAAGTISGP